jgi:DivIVA domain-containing protein
VDVDRQAIERRDFPITRRGYDTAAVDAHLRALAAEFEELNSESTGGAGEAPLASAAAAQVESILAAAETAAADIERQALQKASDARAEAGTDSERTREQAVSQARAHVAATAHATAVLLERVSAMDGEVSALVESLREGAGRLAVDLAAVETNMTELYDAASGRAALPPGEQSTAPVPAPSPASFALAPAPRAPEPPSQELPPPAQRPPAPLRSVPSQPAEAEAGAAPAQAGGGTPPGANMNGDLDGARLVALNMALNGEPRAKADRYLAENFELADRQKLIDEVYAAIDG